MIPLNYY